MVAGREPFDGGPGEGLAAWGEVPPPSPGPGPRCGVSAERARGTGRSPAVCPPAGPAPVVASVMSLTAKDVLKVHALELPSE